MILGSHNSGTGEKPDNFFAMFFPFVAKCQKKTLLEQYNSGVRLFDMRVREHNGRYTIYHGLARYKMTLSLFLMELDRQRTEAGDTDKCVIMITYEGELQGYELYPFAQYMRSMFEICPTLTLGQISVKKPEWRTVCQEKGQVPYEQNYPKIVGWKKLLPFPIIWNVFKKNLDTDGYVMEDFV